MKTYNLEQIKNWLIDCDSLEGSGNCYAVGKDLLTDTNIEQANEVQDDNQINLDLQ